MKIKSHNLISCAFLSIFICSCTTIKSNNFKPTYPAAGWIEPLPATQPHNGKVTNLKHWWQQFNDPVLVELIEAAQKVSPDIESAKARVTASQTAVTVANSQLLPNVTAEASVSRSRSGSAYPSTNGSMVFPTSTTASVGANASWELDVWGRNNASKHEEEAKLVANIALWHDARVIVAAQTAKQYSNYRLCEGLNIVAKKNADSSHETARLSDLTARAGFLAPASASQSLAQAAEAANLQKKQALECTLNIKSLVAITAIPEPTLVAKLATNVGVIPTPADIEITELPAGLLAQRPDVLNAERNVAAASFEIASNEAQRYPRLSLAGNIALSYDSFSRTFSKNRSALDGLTWSIGPLAVSLPIFDAGVRAANVENAKAQYEAAKVTYESVARNAVREVEEALATLNSTAQRFNDANQAAEGFKISLVATEARNKASLGNLFELEEARRASLQAENNLLTLKNERVLAWISLYRAMGGGWTAALNSPTLIFDQKLNQSEQLEADSIPTDSVPIDSAQ
ncbi:RND efflux system, outer membrane lipoprotein, NodT family [Methylotenera versatilis 301]|uniref:RND efflux system, outer membrane lipoprotein, NodT family n=1 Tax=Methylotenera versatilis (strain 301) TaxID=666681 RepID=D7DJB4_METV0|nr:RND efflux system, outer membrane lipoprotein, NodT family [Methylotenera versatilis 301]